MECPKCHKKAADNETVCPNCGTRLGAKSETASRKLLADKRKAIDINPQPAKRKMPVGAFSEKKAKLIAAAAGVVLVIVLVIVLIAALSGSKGEKQAKKISEYIGAKPEVAESKLEEEFKKKSAYNVLNKAVDFDFVVEAEDDITISGITYPEWAIFVNDSKKGNIKTVRYVDFKTVENNIYGDKKDSLINLDKYKAGTDIDDIIDVLGEDIYSITYAKDSITYTYKYWYKSDNGDRQAVILSVVSDTDDEYQSYESRLVYPYDL